MKIADIRELTPEEITTHVSEARKDLVSLRFQQSMRKLESLSKIKATKKKLARLLTIESEKAKNIQGLKPQPKTAAKTAAKAETKTAGKAKAATKASAKKSAQVEEPATEEKATEVATEAATEKE